MGEQRENKDLYTDLKKILFSIPKQLKITMISSFIIGLIAHTFVYTNPFLINDGSSIFWNSSFADLAAGARWFQAIWFRVFDGVQLPWLFGLVVLFLYGFSAYFTCEVLRIKNTLSVIFITGMMVTSPTIIGSHILMDEAHVFALALFFSCLGLYAFYFFKHKYIWCFIFLVISAGTYAPYLSWTASIFLVERICSIIFDDERSFKDEVKDHFLLAFFVAGAYGITFVVSKVITVIQNMGMQGRVDDAAGRSLFGLIFKVGWAFARTVAFFVYYDGRNSYFWGEPLLFVSFWVAFVVTIAALVFCWKRYVKSKNVLIKILLIFDICILPLAMDLIGVFSEFVHTLMSFAFLIPWIIFVKLHDDMDACGILKIEKKDRVRFVYSAVVYWICLITVFSGIKLANTCYMKKYEIYESGLMLANRIADRIESTEGYEPGVTPVYFVGDLRDNYSNYREGMHLADNMYGIGSPYFDASIQYERPLRMYMIQHLGLKLNVACEPVFKRLPAEEYAKILADAGFNVNKYEFISNFNKIGSFPSKECLFLQDGILVVKFDTEGIEE